MAHSSGAFLCDACVLSQNENTSPHFGGGAVTAVGPSANPVFNNSVFSHNIGLGPGGAIYVADSAEPVFVNTQFLYNVDLLTAWGGGAAWIQSDAVFMDCDFVGNTCAGGGGAIWMVRRVPKAALVLWLGITLASTVAYIRARKQRRCSHGAGSLRTA